MTPGTKLGPYEIVALLGKGGMGEVYRARDSKLNRDVAIKVLPAALANDADYLARFQREAQVLAALNHPNIAAIYGLEDGAIVMELVEGATLADRIAQSPLPAEEALPIARQIAEALEAAHEKGIIHRDLKPGNVKITPDGVVKVLDFGLAKTADAPAASDASISPTLTIRATEAGLILGTASYMSPEQASGKPVDKRADIWSFGVVLWEMLTGRRLFEGETISHTLADVLRAPIDFDKLPKETPPAIRDLLRRCLDRDIKTRLRDIGEARIALQKYVANPASEAVTSTTVRRRSWIPWVVEGVLSVLLVVAGVGWWRSTRPVERPLVRLDVDLGPEVALPPLFKNGLALGNVALSPDGTRLAYVSGNPTRLYTHRLDQSKANELPGTEGASSPFFSPDGQWVGFFTGSNPNKLNKISVEGGAVVPLADIGLGQGGSWGADGNIIVGHAYITGLVRVPASGGAPTTALDLAPGEVAYTYPQILPGSKAVLFAAYRGPDANGANIDVFSFADRRRKTLVRGGTSARYLPTGHLVYTIKGTLFAIRFDPDRLETRGTAVPVLDDVAYPAQLGFVDVDFSQTGTLVYRRGGGGSAMLTVQWVDGAGKRETLRAKPGNYVTTRLFSAGTRQAFLVTEGESQDVWLYDLQRDSMTRLTFGSGPYYSPNGSPDGQYVVFGSRKGIYWTRADGAGQPQPLTQSTNPQVPRSFTPDGKRLAYTEAEAGSTGTLQIWTVPLEEQDGQLKAGKPEQFLKSQFFDTEPAFSPDGRWLAYQSNESGKNEVYVRAFPATASGHAGKWQISNNGGGVPLWSRNGRELVYRAGDQLMVVSYSVSGDSFLAEKPRVWIDKLGGIDGPPNYDLAPDGKRVAVLAPVESPDAAKPDHDVTFLFNFFDELRRRVPVGR